jgi:xanthine dehydrogenase YagS FAD-binding subunit
MRRFEYIQADGPAAVVRAASRPGAHYLAGGTTLLDLMKLDVVRPETIIDIAPLASQFGRIQSDARGLHLGAFVSMADAADHASVRSDYPVIAQSLQLAASAQIRNMATLGGNVLQRTRCNYFRNGWDACNKRVPGSGCAARDGVNRGHAVLGTSESCIATYPGDFAQALIALGAELDVIGLDGPRRMHFEDLHKAPGATPHIETMLRPGDLITGFTIPAGPWTRNSLYLKVRDRESYEFALASAAIALDIRDGTVKEARVALGGVATKPWRSHPAEAVLNGRRLDERTARAAAEAAFADAVTHGDNQFKPELGRRTLVRALLTLVEA